MPRTPRSREEIFAQVLKEGRNASTNQKILILSLGIMEYLADIRDAVMEGNKPIIMDDGTNQAKPSTGPTNSDK